MKAVTSCVTPALRSATVLGSSTPLTSVATAAGAPPSAAPSVATEGEAARAVSSTAASTMMPVSIIRGSSIVRGRRSARCFRISGMSSPRFHFPLPFPMFLLFVAVAAGSAAGQTRFDVAPAAGFFSYKDSGPKSGATASVELLLRRSDFGVAVTEEVGGGAAFLATYGDVTYSHSSGPWSILLGTGPSHVKHKELSLAKPWNAEAELGHTW